MVTDKSSYDELIDYLSSSKNIFVDDSGPSDGMPTIETLIEEELSEQIISLCSQHEALEANHRSVIIRELDSIVYDIQQILLEFWQKPATEQQAQFIHEFAGLIKNVFDTQVAELLD
ncbi:MAG: DUF3802 family protein [Gammaproteobacteria bacterium]|nr:DUF3802 family protein [Gammaproteobacteria bacterium]